MGLETRLRKVRSDVAALGLGRRTLSDLLLCGEPVETMTDDELAMLATGDPMATAASLDDLTLAAIAGHNLEC